MGPFLKKDNGMKLRDWTKEEMNAYIDFDQAEDMRVNSNVERHLAAQPFSSHRGLQQIMTEAALDGEAQEDFYRRRNTPK
jgi:hypothetical protein